MAFDEHRWNLKTRLVEQFDHLEASAVRYDQGRQSEANRLAVAVRVLMHDTGMSRSLLGQMGLKQRLVWASSDRMGYDESVLLKTTMVRFRISRTEDALELAVMPIPQPEILDPLFLLPFEVWWTTPVMAAQGVTVSRSDIVDMLANQDGGAHVDLTKQRFIQIMESVPEVTLNVGFDDERANAEGIVTQPREDIARWTLQAMMRTMAEEVGLSLHNQWHLVDEPAAS